MIQHAYPLDFDIFQDFVTFVSHSFGQFCELHVPFMTMKKENIHKL